MTRGLILLLLVLPTAFASAQVRRDEDIKSPVLEAERSTVSVEVAFNPEGGAPVTRHGTGFLVQEGVVLTCFHLVEGVETDKDLNSSRHRILLTAYERDPVKPGQIVERVLRVSKILYVEKEIDLALLEVGPRQKALPSALTLHAKVQVDAKGQGWRLLGRSDPTTDLTQTIGVRHAHIRVEHFPVSARAPITGNREAEREALNRVVLYSLSVTSGVGPGYSGGPVIDPVDGKVVGVVAARINLQPEKKTPSHLIALASPLVLDFLSRWKGNQTTKAPIDLTKLKAEYNKSLALKNPKPTKPTTPPETAPHTTTPTPATASDPDVNGYLLGLFFNSNGALLPGVDQSPILIPEELVIPVKNPTTPPSARSTEELRRNVLAGLPPKPIPVNYDIFCILFGDQRLQADAPQSYTVRDFGYRLVVPSSFRIEEKEERRGQKLVTTYTHATQGRVRITAEKIDYPWPRLASDISQQHTKLLQQHIFRSRWENLNLYLQGADEHDPVRGGDRQRERVQFGRLDHAQFVNDFNVPSIPVGGVCFRYRHYESTQRDMSWVVLYLLNKDLMITVDCAIPTSVFRDPRQRVRYADALLIPLSLSFIAR